MLGANPLGGSIFGGVAQQGTPLPPPPPFVEQYTGVLASQVGAEYDLAMGFDPGTGVTNMVGYCIVEQTEWSEAPNLEDEQRLVTIASPNTSDRYTFYPKITQDDWSGGEGQEFLSDPSKYYQSFKVDPTKPGHLSVVLDAVTIAVSVTGASRAPVVTDGNSLVAGALLASPNALLDHLGNRYYLNAAGTPEPLFGVLDPQLGAFFATAAGANGGIIRLPNVPSGGSQPTPTLWNADIVEPTCTQALAYLSAPAPTGGLYYIRNDNRILQVGAAGAGTIVQTGLSMEQPIRFICNTATGLLFATQSTNTAHQNQVGSIVYSFDGVNSTRIFDFAGIVRAGYEMNGVTYLLFEYGLPSALAPQFTLMAYSNGQLTTLFDQRYASPDFQSAASSFATSPYGASLSGDGRFLYIGWPGYYSLVYDTVRAAFIRWGPSPVYSNLVWAHRFYPLAGGACAVNSIGAGGPTQVTFTRNAAGSTVGTLTSSWIDGGTTGIPKAFRCIEVEMQQPTPVGSTVRLAYRLDQQQAFSQVTNVLTLPNGNLMFLLPPGTKGYRIQLQLLLGMVATTSPVCRSIALTINPGRAWKLQVSCRRGQQKRNGAPDTQGTSTDLLANIFNAYAQGGFVTLYIPDPTNPLGTGTGVPYVSQTTAKIEDRTWHTVVSPGFRWDVDGVGFDAEGLVDLVLAEQL